ncbi:MAG: rhodanese-like domain-containing protein [Bacteroidia bacterium]|nr:MAG: rhodanese-like domain-containing protein [Bacteroidia bacterium]
MLDRIKRLLNLGSSVDFKTLVSNGAIIVDVRTSGEFAAGHIKGAINIPVDQLKNNLNKLKNKEAPIITCCASGMRSASAKSLLNANGYSHVHNGGGWSSLQSKII